MYRLSNSDIERLSSELTSILKNEGVPAQNCTKVRLSAEELLLKYQERFGSETELALQHTKRFGKLIITLQVREDRFDPMAGLTDEDFWLQNILQSPGYVATWAYKNSCNELCFSVRCEGWLPSWAVTLIACGLGAGCGMLARLLPKETVSELSETWFAPVSSALMGFLGAVAMILIFLSIINGIVGLGNLSTLSRIGKKIAGRIIVSLLLMSVIIISVFVLIFPVSGGVRGGFDFGSLWNMILDIVPDSFIDPFNNGNALQILFLSFVTGFLILRSVRSLEPVVQVVQGLYTVAQDMMLLILKALPLVVFISIFDLFSGSSDIDLQSVYKFPLIQFLLSFLWVASAVLWICVKKKVRPSVLVKKMLPTFLIGLSTASSNAALSASMESCEKEMGVNPKLVKVGIPLLHSLDKPTGMILLMTGTMCMAQMFSVDISWTELITMTLTVFLLNIAVPAVPGAGVSIMTILLSLYGIPYEALSVIISLDVITDRIVTSSIVANAQLDLIRIADSLGDLNKEVLRK